MCQVIAITNQKGGVGKTTTTFHLGTKLAQEGKRVLLIDADPQASLTASFGIREADTLNITLTNALQAIVEDEPIDPAIGIRTHEEGAKLFPANIELASFETAMINVMSREYIMREFVNTYRPNFDYILIDCMPSLGMLTVNALAAADSVIIPSQPSFLSAKGLDLLLHSVAKVKRSINPTLDISGILLTMVDGRTNNARDIATTIRASYGEVLAVSTSTIYELIKRKCFDTFLVDSWMRIPKDSFQAWYCSQEVYRTAEDRKEDEKLRAISYSMPDIRKMLGVHRNCVYSLLDHHKTELEFLVVAGQKRVTKASFDAWLAARGRYTKVVIEPAVPQQSTPEVIETPDQSIPEEKPVYRIEEVQAILNLSRKAIYKRIQDGRMIAMKAGNTYWVPAKEVEKQKEGK